MFDKFGEFDSVEEINLAAAAQKAEGDDEALFLIAKENGIDREDAQDYLDGFTEELATPIMAAMGKIKLEKDDLKVAGSVLEDWTEHLIQMCTEDEELCRAVRKKGKRLEKCLGNILKLSFEEKKKIDDRIVRAAGLRTPLYIGIPAKKEIREIIRKYYGRG